MFSNIKKSYYFIYFSIVHEGSVYTSRQPRRLIDQILNFQGPFRSGFDTISESFFGLLRQRIWNNPNSSSLFFIFCWIQNIFTSSILILCCLAPQKNTQSTPICSWIGNSVEYRCCFLYPTCSIRFQQVSFLTYSYTTQSILSSMYWPINRLRNAVYSYLQSIRICLWLLPKKEIALW